MAKHRDGGEDGEEDGQQVEADRQLEGHKMSHHCSGFFMLWSEYHLSFHAHRLIGKFLHVFIFAQMLSLTQVDQFAGIFYHRYLGSLCIFKWFLSHRG